MALVNLSTDDRICLFVNETILDGSLVTEIRDLCRKKFAEKPRPIVFDLNRVKYVDSEAIGGLLAL